MLFNMFSISVPKPRKSPKSRDLTRLFLSASNLGITLIITPLPVLAVSYKLHSFYYVLELLLLSPFDRENFTILPVLMVRIFLVLVCVFEFNRYIFALIIFPNRGYLSYTQLSSMSYSSVLH